MSSLLMQLGFKYGLSLFFFFYSAINTQMGDKSKECLEMLDHFIEPAFVCVIGMIVYLYRC